MGLAGILSSIGVIPESGSTASDGTQYTFSQQQKDFIKLQFKYGILLKNKLDAGQISQAYYDSHFWLTTQTLEPPYNGWLNEFETAIKAEDLNWLAKQVGETVDQLVAYMGDALGAVASTAGRVIGTAGSSATSGLISGFFGSLNPVGWLVLAGLGVAVYYGWKKGLIQSAIKTKVIV